LHLPFYEQPRFLVEFFLALATFGLFVATYLVARRTAQLGADTVKATKVADKHHQEALTPVVEWVCTAQALPIYPPDYSAGPLPPPIRYLISYSGTVKNVGTGPALNVRASFVFADRYTFDYGGQGGKQLQSLGPGEQYDDTFEQRVHSEPRITQMEMPYTVTITYDNIFGKQCTTLHKNAGGDRPTITTFTPPDTTPRV
jgi:hypothetical protein